MKHLNFRKVTLIITTLIITLSMLGFPMVKPENTEGGIGNLFLSAIGADKANAQTPVFYVATNGSSSGDGSYGNPWDLQTALNQPRSVVPGSVIYMRGGVYRGAYVSNLKGSSAGYIVVRRLPGERVTLVNNGSPALDMGNTWYVTFMQLEITGSYGSRATTPSAYGIRVNQGATSHHIRIVNMYIHDVLAQGIAWWQALTESEIYGSLIYYNGTTKLDHGVYAHNTTGTKYFINNFVFDNASHGFHGYAETADKGLNNMHIEENTFFNNGSIGGTYKRNILMGGLTPANGAVINANRTYYPGSAGESLNLGYSAGSNNSLVVNNYFAGGAFTVGGSTSRLTLAGNTIYAPGGINGVNPGSYGSNAWLSSKPSGTAYFVQPNKYETNRANITIYNWGGSSSIFIPAKYLGGIPLVPGRRYELRNVQDYFSDAVTQIYDGNGIYVPMTNHTVAQPLGLSGKPASTFPTFGGFILIAK